MNKNVYIVTQEIAWLDRHDDYHTTNTPKAFTSLVDAKEYIKNFAKKGHQTITKREYKKYDFVYRVTAMSAFANATTYNLANRFTVHECSLMF